VNSTDLVASSAERHNIDSDASKLGSLPTALGQAVFLKGTHVF